MNFMASILISLLAFTVVVLVPWIGVGALNLRVLFGYMYMHPGKKLLFMGNEFAQENEWDHNKSLDWHLLQSSFNDKMRNWVNDLNHLYKNESALHELDFENEGFEWIDLHDEENSIISFLRRGKSEEQIFAIICNFTPVPRYNYRVGVPQDGFWKEILNSDAKEYGGSGQGNIGSVEASPASFYGIFDYSLSITLPPLSILIFKWQKAG